MSNEQLIRIFSSQTPQDKSKDENDVITSQKQTVFQKMKQLTKDYWHILIPVHVATSIVWISIFYTAAKKFVYHKYLYSLIFKKVEPVLFNSLEIL